jgi:hypothetical protein
MARSARTRWAATKSASDTSAGCVTALTRRTRRRPSNDQSCPSPASGSTPPDRYSADWPGSPHRWHRPHPTQAVAVAFRIAQRRAQHTTLVQLAGDARQVAPRQPAGEHPPHMRRGDRLRVQPLQALAPRGLRSVRMRPGVHQSVRVRRAPAQEAALFKCLRAHRRQRPMPGTRQLPLRDRPQCRDQRPVRRIGGIHRPVRLRQPHPHPVTLQLLGHPQELSSGEPPLVLPHDDRVEPPPRIPRSRQQRRRPRTPFAERERALAAADPTGEDLAAGGPQAGRGDRRDLDVPDEVDPGNHRVAHPRPQDRVAGRRRGRPGDGRDLRLPGDPCRSGARPRQCTDTKSVTTGNPGQARPGQLRRHQHRPARHPREDPAQATAVPPRTPRRISRPDRAGPPASSATTSKDPGLSHSVGGGPPGRLSRSLPGGPPEARSEAPCSR